mgnify:CR=1 FL=1
MSNRDELAEVIALELNNQFKSHQVAYFLDGVQEAPTDVTDWISTGSTILDLAISNKPHGGFAAGRIAEINGLESSGKSLIGAHALATTQRKDGLAVYIDTESSVSSEFLQAIGIDTDGGQMYTGYCKAGDKVTFKVLDASTGSLVDMDVEGDVMWNDMGISVINLTDIFLPTEVSLSNAYPNPFNPVTMLTYDVPSDMNVSMGIYDVRGRLVEELVNDMREQGRYEITWNADQHSSGVYMIKMTAGTAVKVQKVMLVK